MTFAAVAVGVGVVGAGAIAADATKDAASTSSASSDRAIASSENQASINRADLLPFLDAARGEQTGTVFNESDFNTARAQFDKDVEDIRGSFGVSRVARGREQAAIAALGNRPTRADFTTATREGGALQDLQQGINQGPDVPQIDQFQGQAVAAPNINRFQGQAVQSPELVQAGPLPDLQQFTGSAVNAPNLQQFNAQAPGIESFNFDPQAALNSPALQFQQEQGQRQVDRVAGKNRQLGSGQRLIDAQKFGQGLASQSLGDEFNRQLTGVNQRNQATQQDFGNQQAVNQLQNLIAQQQFGLGSQQLGQNIDINQLQNQITQGGIGNRNNQTQLANQIAGQQFGLNTQSLGQQQGLNQFGNQQAIEQQNLDRQFLGDRLNLDQTNQNRLLTQFGLQNDAFNSRLNRLAGLVDVGARTGSALGATGANSANNVSNLLQAQGNTQAAAQLGRANIIGNTLQQGIGAAAQFGAFSPPPTTAQQFGTIPGSQQTNLLAEQQAGFLK